MLSRGRRREKSERKDGNNSEWDIEEREKEGEKERFKEDKSHQ